LGTGWTYARAAHTRANAAGNLGGRILAGVVRLPRKILTAGKKMTMVERSAFMDDNIKDQGVKQANLPKDNNRKRTKRRKNRR
jgi:hypothetical protein